MPKVEDLKISGELISIKGLWIAGIVFLVCFVLGWAMIKGGLSSRQGAGTPYGGIGAAFIAIVMFSLLPGLLGFVSILFLNDPYDSAKQRVFTLLVFLGIQVVWNYWLYFLEGLDYFC